MDSINSPSALSLYELNSLVSSVLSISLPDEYWVEAELSEARGAWPLLHGTCAEGRDVQYAHSTSVSQVLGVAVGDAASDV